jgi:hypothetical protein
MFKRIAAYSDVNVIILQKDDLNCSAEGKQGSRKHDYGLLHLKIGIFLLLLLENELLVSGSPIHAHFS